MFELKGIDHIVIRAHDLDQMVSFYTEVIGCSLDKRRDDLGLVHLRAGASLIDLISLDGPLGKSGGAGPGAEGRNMDHLCLRVDVFDYEDLRKHFRRFNVSVSDVQSNYGADGNGPSVYISDPEGNVIEFKGPPYA
jgi:glyoxylase I family protein